MTQTPSRLSGLSFVNPQHAGPGGPVQERVPAGSPRPLDADLVDLDGEIAGAGRLWTFPEWRSSTYTTSLVVVDGGVLRSEWYADGLGPGDLFLGASMTKSALAHLVGAAVSTGALRPDDPVTAHVPELAGGGYDGTTVEHLLTMTSGVDWVEDHRDPDSAASRLLACFDGSAGGSRDLLCGIGRRSAPGTRYEYCTADSQVLDWVRERATGQTYVEALTALWDVLHCERDALVCVERAGGVALAGGGLAATARDWARVGMLEVDGTVDGRRVLDAGWVERTAVPSQPFLAPGRLPSSITTHAGFGFHWWPLDDAGRRVAADGSRGQLTYVDRDRGVVVVKTSQWPYDDWLADRQYRDLSYLGLPAVARAADRRTSAADRVVTPLEGRPAPPWDPDAPIGAPLRLHRCTVAGAWVDYNRHMSESCYLLVFGDNADAFFRFVGIDEAYRAAGHSLYTVETHLHHRGEAAEGEPLSLTLQLLGYDAKRVHLFHEMTHGDTGAVVARAEQLLVHVDTREGRSSAMSGELQDRLAAVAAAHAVLPRPDAAGRPMRVPGGGP